MHISPYQIWNEALHLTNGLLELVCSTTFGPRLLHFSRTGAPNLLAVLPHLDPLPNGWRIIGGHRLWYAPEAYPRTYQPDQDPLQVDILDDYTVRLTQPDESTSGLQKQIQVELDPAAPVVRLTHRLTNHAPTPVQLAPWALTVMAPGGTAYLPIAPRRQPGENQLPVQTLALWDYTDLSDPRWTFGRDFLICQQRAEPGSPQKIGLLSPQSWLAYWSQGELFIKQSPYLPGRLYPDLNCNIELYTDRHILELETLAPLVELLPGASIDHTETWQAFSGIPQPQTEADIAALIIPRLLAL